MRNKYQKTKDGNVIVELDGSKNRHIYHENIEFKNPRVLSDAEIIGIGMANMSDKDRLEICKSIVKRIDGFAISNVKNDTIKIGDIVEINSKLQIQRKGLEVNQQEAQLSDWLDEVKL